MIPCRSTSPPNDSVTTANRLLASSQVWFPHSTFPRHLLNWNGDETYSDEMRKGSQLHRVEVAVEPTGWSRVDRGLDEARRRLEEASTEEQFQAVGLFCREVLISLAQAIYDPSRHPSLDGVDISDSDVKRMFDSYLEREVAGGVKANTRKYAKAAYDLALQLQHKRSAAFRQAAFCLEATASVVNVVAILSGLRDP